MGKMVLFAAFGLGLEKREKRAFLGIPGIFFTSKTPFEIEFYMEMSFQKKKFQFHQMGKVPILPKL